MGKEEEKNRRESRLDEFLGNASEETSKKQKEEEYLNEKSEFICSNKWCKGKYMIERYRYYNDGVNTCPKCRSFENELRFLFEGVANA